MPAVDAVLVRPPYRQSEYDEVTQEPLGLGMIAAALRAAGMAVAVVDAEIEGMQVDDVLAMIADLEPALVGMTVVGRGSLAGALDVTAGVKRWAAPAAHVTLGGMFASFAAAEILQMAPAVDSVVLFEGETAGAALARAVSRGAPWRDIPGIAFRDDGVVRVNEHSVAPPLDDLPWAARDVLPLVLEQGKACSLLSSRGCLGHCTFCSAHAFNRASGRCAWMGRSVAPLVDELASLHERFALRELVFVDDDFVGNDGEGRRRAFAFAAELERRGLDFWFEIETRPDLIERVLLETLRAAGLRSLFIGIESVVPRAQEFFGKPLSAADIERALALPADLGLVVHAGYIMFHPYSDLDEIATSFAFLRGVGQATPHSLTNTLHVAPGAALLPRLRRDGTACGAPVLGFTLRFGDEAVARLHTMVLLSVRAVFPCWYRLVQRRAAALTALRDAPGAAARRRRDAVERALVAVEAIACRTFAEALELARAGEPDVVARGLELRGRAAGAAAQVEAALLATLRPGAYPDGAATATRPPKEVHRVP